MMRKTVVLAIMTVLVLHSHGSLGAAEATAAPVTKPAESSAEQARNAAIRAELQRIDRILADHGGSWEAWSRQLQPFRKDVKKQATGKWPWDAKNDFVFLGKSLRLLLQDEVTATGKGAGPEEVIVDYHRQLREMGIDLILVPIPDKLAIYPDYLSKEAPEDRFAAVQMQRLYQSLLKQGVEVVNLHPEFLKLRKERGEQKPIYYDRDSHWRNVAARHAGKLLAERLKRYGFSRKALADGNPYTDKQTRRTDGNKADEITIIVQKDSGKPYEDVAESPAILFGDSYSMYNMHNGAHLSAQAARFAGVPLTYICRSGLAVEVPLETARRHERKKLLNGRKVVVWTFCTRHFVRDDWRKATLSRASKTSAPKLFRTPVTATIAGRSAGPSTKAEYPDYLMKFHLKDVKGRDGKAIADGEVIAVVQAMKDRKLLPAAKLEKGSRVKLDLTGWQVVRKKHDTTETGTLPDTRAELDLPVYFGENLSTEK